MPVFMAHHAFLGVVDLRQVYRRQLAVARSWPEQGVHPVGGSARETPVQYIILIIQCVFGKDRDESVAPSLGQDPFPYKNRALLVQGSFDSGP